MHYFKLKYY